MIARSELFKDSMWALGGSAIGKGFSLVAGIIVARLLGKEVYGEYGIIRTTLTYLAIVSSFGLGYTATKYIADYLKNQSEKIKSFISFAYKVTIIFSAFLTVLQTIFADQIATFINAPHLALVLRYFSILIIVNALTSTQIGVLSGFKKFKEIAYINIIAGFVTFVFSATLPIFWGLSGAIMALLIAYIVQLIISSFVIGKCCQECKQEAVGKQERREIIKFSFPIALQDSLFSIVHWLTTYILVLFANYGEVGLLSAAGMWQSVVIFIPAMLKNVMFSHLTSSDDHKTLVNRLLLVNLVSSAFPVIIVAILSKFISTFYGPSFSALPGVLSVSVCSAIFICLADVYSYEFISLGKTWFVFLSRLLRDSIYLCVSYLVISSVHSHYSFYMAAIGLLVYILFFLVMMVLYQTMICKNNLSHASI